MRYWIVKGKPSENDFENEKWFAKGLSGTWHTAKPPKSWNAGDRLFFWKSSPALCLVGLGVFDGINRVKKDYKGRTRFNVTYLTSTLDQPLYIDELRRHFSDDLPSFLKAGPAGTVFPLTNDQGENLYRMTVQSNPEVQNIWPDMPPAEAMQSLPDVEQIDSAIVEGGRKLITHLRRERNRKIVMDKKCQALKETGTLKCEVCEFDFREKYGEVGEGFCEVHHKKPLSENDRVTKTHLKDLAILCSNCHRMIHRTNPMLSVTAFKRLLAQKASSSTDSY